MKRNLVPNNLLNYDKAVSHVSRSILSTSCKTANKTLITLAKYQEKNNETNNRYINIMEAQQSINFIFAQIKLGNRRMRRANQEHARLVATGKQDGYFRIAWGWVVDYFLLLIDIIWCIIQPILLIFVMLIIRTTLILFFTSFVFYLLYKLITH